MAFKSKLFAAFGTALAILVCVGVLSYLKVRQTDEEISWVDHTHLLLKTNERPPVWRKN
jgi:CHASE3 domain sensor protein